MLDIAAACFGLGAGAAVLLLSAPARGVPLRAPLTDLAVRLGRGDRRLAESSGWTWLDHRLLLGLELAGATLGCLLGLLLSGLVALALTAGVGGAVLVRAAVKARARSRRHARQDAVLEAIRLLRQLLETGGVGVQQCISVLAERGPVPLRSEFAGITAAALAGRQRAAWREARARVEEPVFDLLAAAVLVQRPAGGALGPLFTDVEETVTAIHEVEREAEALQVQARSAARLIICLPIAFLLVLTALRSPYLDAYRSPAGELFLILMFAIMGLSYLWMLRWLRLPQEPRMDLADA
ncbi:MAG: type II secretion system F family protein [Candidatus Dormibacteraceae bacterium]